ncbi:MAG: FAD binding domain-containing protein [Deltaproteobacteria bacterium]|nr:FAD binding domain-containing protein [Deltaproteobacteria bacterium]
MRAYLPDYQARSAKDLKDALKVLSGEPGLWKPLAGATDLMVLFAAGKLPRGRYLNIRGLKELRGIGVTKDFVSLGALTTYTEIRGHSVLMKEFPNLCAAARETGAIAIQNRGTIGGNIANASPAADSPPALLVYDAEIELVSSKGARWVPYAGFHLAYKKMVMRPDELIRAVRLPRRAEKFAHFYRKIGTRRAQAISKVCFSGKARLEKNGRRFLDARIAVGSVAPIPLRCLRTEAAIVSRDLDARVIANARKIFLQEISPIDDIRSTRDYRAAVAGNVFEQFIQETAGL